MSSAKSDTMKMAAVLDSNFPWSQTNNVCFLRFLHDICIILTLLLTLCRGNVSKHLCDSMDNSPPGSSVHGILWARILEWVAILFSRGSSHLGIEPRSPALQADSLLSESPGKPWCLDVILTKCIYIGLTLSNSSLQQTQCLPNLSTGTCHNPGLACFFFKKLYWY